MRNYNEINKAMKTIAMDKKLGTLTGLDTDVLVSIASGEINMIDFAKWALANRGLNKQGKWVGFFDAAKEAQE